MKNQKPLKLKGGAAVGSTALLGSVEYCSDLKYCANYLRTVATDLERHEPGAEHGFGSAAIAVQGLSVSGGTSKTLACCKPPGTANS